MNVTYTSFYLCVHQLVAMPYLHDTLNGAIETIYQEKKACELDPSRVGWVRR